MDVFLQSEASECGLACLAMIASHHGDNRGLRVLRGLHPASRRGVSLLQLVEVAACLGLQGRAVRLDLHEVGKLALPCVLHFDSDHFVVLSAVKRRRLIVVDPAVGTTRLSWTEFSRRFTGIALELTPRANFQPSAKPPAITIRQLGGNLDSLGRSIGLVLALSVALQVFVIVAPFHVQWVVDHALVSADKDLLNLLGIAFLAILLLQVSTDTLRAWTVVHLSNHLGRQWLGSISAHLFRLPVAFFEKRHLGDVISRVGSAQSIQRSITTSFVEAIVDGLMATMTSIMMFLYSWRLACVSLIAMLAYLLLRLFSFLPLRRATEGKLVSNAEQEGHLLESLRGMQSIKVSGYETIRLLAFQNLITRNFNRDVVLGRIDLLFSSASHVIFGLERLVVVWLGAMLALDRAFSVGMVVSYIAYRDQFSSRVSSLVDKGIEFSMLRLHAERLADIALATPEKSSTDPIAFVIDEASLSVVDVCFRYSPSDALVLNSCSFRVAAGESVAIVGPSGCGKTTLLKVLLGLLDCEKGVIQVGGRNLTANHRRSFRQQIGVVMQDDQVFSGSIAENIAFGDEVPDFDRVQDAARLAFIHEDVLAMPMGYQSLVGDMGAVFSGGQRQRILLARALYRQPRMLFLDEASSHLDVASEQQVTTAISRLTLTRLFIAHRPETIASADRVLVMEGGRIVRDVKRGSDAQFGSSVGEA